MERFRRRESTTSTTTQGTQKTQIHNPHQTTTLESHFRSYTSIKEDSLMYEMRRNSSELNAGTPMKKLLAQEMNEMEGKRRSPSVVGRLMGLDAMPSHHPVQRQHKTLSNKKKVSIEKQKFKDVYEDLEASHVTNHRSSSHNSLLNYLQEVDSLNAKHMHISYKNNGNSSSSHHTHSPNSKNYKPKIHQGSDRRDCLLSYALESSEPEEKTQLKTIVILKPSVWALCNDVKAISSSGTIIREDHQLNLSAYYLSSDSPDHLNSDSPDHLNSDSPGKTNSKKAREIAREVVEQMKQHSIGSRLTSPFTVSDIPLKLPSRKSSVIREAKRRISARLKSTRTKSRYEQAVTKGISIPNSTLGDMLATPESKMKGLMLVDGHASLGCPLVQPNAESFNTKESRSKKSQSRHSKHEMDSLVLSQIPSSVGSTSSVSNGEIEERINVSSASSDELRPFLRMDDSAKHQAESNLQVPSRGALHGDEPVAEPVPEPSESSKESNHHSPVSVFSIPTTEDVSSSSYSFESVSVGLQELKLQLQLLRMESQSNYAESPIHEDMWPESDPLQNWESSYIVDLLIESGFDENEPDIFTRVWYSQDCPLGPWVFKNLEIRYTDELTCQSSIQRKILFDRVNSALVEIFEPSMNPMPWVKPLILTVGSKLQKNGIEYEVNKILERQENEAREIVKETTAVDRETEWLDLEESIDEVGIEIESLVIHELIEELITIM